MCFWFGLEILKLVNKKVFYELLKDFYLSGQNQNHVKQSDLGKSLDPSARPTPLP